MAVKETLAYLTTGLQLTMSYELFFNASTLKYILSPFFTVKAVVIDIFADVAFVSIFATFFTLLLCCIVRRTPSLSDSRRAISNVGSNAAVPEIRILPVFGATHTRTTLRRMVSGSLG